MNDPHLFGLVEREQVRQDKTINLIPSENIISKSISKLLGSCLSNKYSEGYPGKRYYQGNRFIDEIESLAINRAKMLFNMPQANVQPHSGSSANMAAFLATLNYGDKIMGMELSHGGHLTHGCKVNFSGKNYNFISYGVEKDTEQLDMDNIQKIAEKEMPKMIISGFTAYPRKIDFKRFADIAKSINAISLADISHVAGLIAADLHNSPAPYTDIITTTTHKTLRGPRGAIILCQDPYIEKINKAIFPGIQGGPHENVIAAKSQCFFEAHSPSFARYSKQVLKNAKVLAETLMQNNIKLVTNGTDNHLILIDLHKTLNKPSMGKYVAIVLEKAGIIVNYNMIPFDQGTPWEPSGIRLGTPFITSQGAKEEQMREIGQQIADIITNFKQ